MGFNTAEISHSKQWRFLEVAIYYETKFGFKNARRMQYT